MSEKYQYYARENLLRVIEEQAEDLRRLKRWRDFWHKLARLATDHNQSLKARLREVEDE